MDKQVVNIVQSEILDRGSKISVLEEIAFVLARYDLHKAVDPHVEFSFMNK